MIPSLEVLHEEAGLPDFDLPPELREAYGGTLGFEEPSLFANFVSSIDGVVSIPGTPRSNQLIGAGSEGDRFVMALLRACADVVVLGSGTLRGSPGAIWTAGDAYPPTASAFAELRRRLGRPAEPELAVVTASGAIDPDHRALAAGALVLTTERGAAMLEGRLPPSSELVALPGDDAVDLHAAVDLLHARGFGRILSEAGPTVFGSLLEAGLVDELFLTVSPLLAGRPGDLRLGLAEGVGLLPDRKAPARLLGVRRQGGHLFLRYALG
jgi:riboflavin biosynthesis pyrimidine reductase